MPRTEFGASRTTCSCNACILNCRHMPGNLIPSDLDRMTLGIADVYRWAEQNLLASPGAIVKHTAADRVFRIGTLVPAVKPDGSCIHLTADDRCAIHANAPFGCAFFDCGPAPEGLPEAGFITVLRAHADGLYGKLWRYLEAKGKKQRAPEILRSRIHKAWAEKHE